MYRSLFPVLLSLCIAAFAHADMDAGTEAQKKGDYATAFKEFIHEARQGNPYAMGKVAGMYLYGAGVEKNLVEAYAWFSLAVDQGDRSAEDYREAVGHQLSDIEIRRASVLKEDYYDLYVQPFIGQEISPKNSE